MNFRKWALEYVFACLMTAWHFGKKERFGWIIKIAMENWPLYWFVRLQNKLEREGIRI